MTSINKTPKDFQHYARKFVTQMSAGGYAPVILLEAAVTGGRTYQAYKRGGFVEARERGTEETLGAIFWLGGVHAFNKMGDKLGAKLFKMKDFEFDVAQDAVRTPFKSFLKVAGEARSGKLAAFKFGKVLASVLMANAMIGFVVPKLNQGITNRYQKNLNQNKNEPQKLKNQVKQQGMDGFITRAEGDSAKTAFKGGMTQTLLTFADKLERDATCKLIATDVGVVGGRAANARNKHERTEILVRDVGSIYFYMFCKDHINALLNYVQTGKTTRLDPCSAKIVHEHLSEKLKGVAFNDDHFVETVLGKSNVEVPKDVLSKFTSNGIITLEDFQNTVGKTSSLSEVAQRMSGLQPASADLAGKSILTRSQVDDIFKGGLINDPAFLKEFFSQYTEKASQNPFKYVSEDGLRELKSRVSDYIDEIRSIAKKLPKDSTMETILQKANKKNFMRNGLNLGFGLGISALFLSTIIPKVQYWITQKQTGENKFPGIQQYDK